MFPHFILMLLPVPTTAIPFTGASSRNHSIAEPFAELGAFPGRSPIPGFGIFRRQSCPSLSLACPSGVCCSYATSLTTCCGRNCCAEGYLCTGGTQSNPCCVAISSPTNTCGTANQNSNPCVMTGYLPCNGVNFCCPPNSICYFDSARNPMCAPRSISSSTTTTTSSSSRTTSTITTTSITSSITTSTTTTTSRSRKTSSTTTSRRSQPTPIDNTSDETTDGTIEYNYPPLASEHIPWTWYVKSSDPDAVCPSASKTLVTFAAVIATLYKNTPGYEGGFSVADLFLFWTTRPRLSWLLLAAVIGVGADYEENGYWESAAKSAMIAEVILLLISTYYMGRTADFARVNGYYSLGSTATPNAKLMYAGALMSLIFIFATLIYMSIMIVTKHGWESTGKVVFFLVGIATTTWLASWLFWVGYIYTAGDLYCPPKLAATGTIWAVFSLVGNMLGGGGM